MRKGKRILSGLLLALCLVSFCMAGKAVKATNTVTINGTVYKLSNPDNFTDLSMVELQAKNLYEALADHPEVPTYVYLINSSRTVNVREDVTAVPVVYKAIEKYFTKSTTDYLHLDSLEQYAEYFYTTDHHWNYKGSYAGYCQIVRMLLGEDEPVLEPVETVTFPVRFNGSMNKNLRLQDSKELFTVYRFEYPEMKIEVNGLPKAAIGGQETYFAGRYSTNALFNHYGKFYGGDNELVHIETERTDRGNLILFSNSFSNAIVQLLASHFHHLWVVDLRYFEPVMKKNFHFSEILEEGNVQVMLLGDGVFFTQKNPYQKLR